MPIVIPYLAGRLPQGRLGVGWKVLSQPVAPAAEPTLTVREVDARLTALGEVSGTGSQAERARLVGELMAAATEDEQRFLFGLLTGEVRQGALDARRRGGARGGDRRARGGRTAGGDARRFAPGGGAGPARRRPGGARRLPAHRRPPGPADAGAHRRLGHRGGRQARRLRGRGEARRHPRPGAPGRRRRTRSTPAPSTTSPTGCPNSPRRHGVAGRAVHPGRRGDRARRRRAAAFLPGDRRRGSAPAWTWRRPRETVPVSPVFFDALSVDGRDLLDLPFAERHAELARLVPEPMRVRRTLVSGPGRCRARPRTFLADTLARGHEGVVVKALDAPYSAGRRGASWLKVKPVHTLDLVVLAAEWGHGRRTGKLSNLHLGARTADGSLRDARQDLQGHDRRDAHLADRAAPGAGRRGRRPRGDRTARTRRRDRLRRPAALHPLPGRRHPPLRPRRALPRGQDGRTRPTPSRPCWPPTRR